MLMGIKMRAYPTEDQRKILSQWMGCARVVWNAKCEEWRYQSTYARKYMVVGTYANVDQMYSQYKGDLTPYLSEVPSQVLRNAATNWYDTMRKWMRGLCRPARRKKKTWEASVHLTSELYEFVEGPNGSLKLLIGTKKFPVGELKIKVHRHFFIPKSIRIKKKAGLWFVSFCYDDALNEEELVSDQEFLKQLKTFSKEELERKVMGVDRGVAVACQTDQTTYDFAAKAKVKEKRRKRYISRYQKRLSKQKKGSRRREKTKAKISSLHAKSAHVRENFCHQTSHALTKTPGQLIVMEDLKTSQMTRRPKAKKNEITGKWEKNRAAQKAGLNRSILSVGWHKLEALTKYKARRRGSLLVKISPQFSSQECADCGHIHPGNRPSQELFQCLSCGHRDNADRNAALVLKKRAINLILNSGTELSERGVLHLPDTGRGVQRKTSKGGPRKQGLRSVKKDGGGRVLIPEAQDL